jgi:hypothetical protein
VIAAPLNDKDCLAKLTHAACSAIGREDMRRFAARFRSTEELASAIRALPQRDDLGERNDGPRVQCDVSQRARIPADDPNCVERALLYLVAAELIDLRPRRQLATLDLPQGRHTVCVEDGEAMLLEPSHTRNGLASALFRVMQRPERNAKPIDAEVSVLGADDRDLMDWVGRIADEPAYEQEGMRGRRRVARARSTLGYLALGAPVEELRKARRAQDDLAYTIEQAAKAAKLWGGMGLMGVSIVKTALSTLGLLPRRNCGEGMPSCFYDLEAWADDEIERPQAAPGGAKEEGR